MAKNKPYMSQNLAYLLSEFYNASKKSICFITKNDSESKLLLNELKYFLKPEEVLWFPESEILPYDHFSIPNKITKKRFAILNKENNSKNIIITSVKNLFERFPSIEYFKSSGSFDTNTRISIDELTNIVIKMGYQKISNVEKINQYSVRGGIIDIYSPLYKNPLRIEIFDNNIESIRLFDVESQLSNSEVKKFSLSKGDLIPLNIDSVNLFKSKWRDYFQDSDERYCELFQLINNNKMPEGIEVYLPFFFNDTSDLTSLLSNYKFVRSDDLDEEIRTFNNFISQRYEDELEDIQRPLIKPNDLFIDSKNILLFIEKVKKIDKTKSKLNINNFNDLVNEVNKGFLNKKKVVLLFSHQNELENYINNFTQIKLIQSLDECEDGVNFMIGNFVRPTYLESHDIYIFHKNVLSNDYQEINEDDGVNVNRELFNSDFESFYKNDLVIHEDYGLGLFDGLEIVTTNTIENEYLKIKYDKNENLYVPLRNVNKLSGYHKNDLNQNIKLDSLSSTKWKTKKRKAFERSIDHAAEILDIESRRNKSNSFVLKVDDRNLNVFKDDFPYTETIDQTNSFNQIRHDLSLLKPMNRVLCGDVGFGKTEVAMQASYISVFSGKQVIIITPSTILCEQHFITFKDRFAKHPVIINKINRNEGKKLNDKTITEFNNKKVDILITTHIIFNNNINFKNTGLLIVDEEHKFGIKQKNYIKDKQSNIHILYLSATPIPRTMSMVFAGLKDFSFINSPPSNRVSVKSFLKVQTKQLIKEALIRERNRNGQCFIVQNNISKMETLKREINQLLPDFKISLGHGKLNKKDISKVMLDFRNGNVDGLICTTIVEMGLDISNANTMIIIDSHNFGLAQLHQLRGRVGRSEKQGYCYFMIPTMEIPKIAKNRLDSVVRYSNLGEGYFIAQEDLEIRGGGEMLGEKQSGHVDSVGLSLYLSMLKESLNIVTNKKESEIEVNFNDSSYINESYLPSPVERLKIYRKINKSSNLEELNKVKNSLNDRCGKMPQETKNLLDNKTIILKINGSGIESIKSSEKKTTISLSKRINNKLFKKIIDLTNNDQNCSISKDNKLIYTHNKFELIDRRKIVHNLLNEIL